MLWGCRVLVASGSWIHLGPKHPRSSLHVLCAISSMVSIASGRVPQRGFAGCAVMQGTPFRTAGAMHPPRVPSIPNPEKDELQTLDMKSKFYPEAFKVSSS